MDIRILSKHPEIHFSNYSIGNWGNYLTPYIHTKYIQNYMIGAAKPILNKVTLEHKRVSANLALNNNNSSTEVNCDTPWMLQNICSKFANKYSILCENLHLKHKITYASLPILT